MAPEHCGCGVRANGRAGYGGVMLPDMARRPSRTRIIVETLVVAAIFIIVHLPIYPPYGEKPARTPAPAEACGASPATPCPESAAPSIPD